MMIVNRWGQNQKPSPEGRGQGRKGCDWGVKGGACCRGRSYGGQATLLGERPGWRWHRPLPGVAGRGGHCCG
jgi:hypothetical protein